MTVNQSINERDRHTSAGGCCGVEYATARYAYSMTTALRVYAHSIHSVAACWSAVGARIGDEKATNVRCRVLCHPIFGLGSRMHLGDETLGLLSCNIPRSTRNNPRSLRAACHDCRVLSAYRQQEPTLCHNCPVSTFCLPLSFHALELSLPHGLLLLVKDYCVARHWLVSIRLLDCEGGRGDWRASRRRRSKRGLTEEQSTTLIAVGFRV
eukprot:6906308-Prymnesium_polylepis.2